MIYWMRFKRRSPAIRHAVDRTFRADRISIILCGQPHLDAADRRRHQYFDKRPGDRDCKTCLAVIRERSLA